MSFKEQLAQANAAWGKAKEESKKPWGGSNIPDGRYIAVLSGAEVGESQSSGRLQVDWCFSICEGDQKGDQVHNYSGLDSEDNLVWFARFCARLGLEPPEELEELENWLEEVLAENIYCRISLKTKNDFQNLRVDKVLEDYDPTA